MLRSRTSCLQPVRWRGQPAMLKLSEDPQEQQAGALMAWWAPARRRYSPTTHTPC
ncbi:hypothetical protein [Bordetella trematum]|uniref:hypothetical protein n=1 Tax=Bordetella trematum TaxID=123899 RepID=UPI003AF34D7B